MGSSSPRLPQLWRTRGPRVWPLLPLVGLFAALAALRRAAYRLGWLPVQRLPVPVVVVGNITAGGAGKTPLTLYLAQALRAAGRRPGIVSRGYGGSGEVRAVEADSDATVVGDEPLLLRRRAQCPVFVGRHRAEAGQALLAAHPECDVILCDDGLQHLALARDMEIAVLDRRGVMNGLPLPAGPLREPVSRLATVDALVLNGLADFPGDGPRRFAMSLAGERFYRLGDPGQTCTARDLAGLKLHALAGIGEPQRFFDHLAGLGLTVAGHAFADHHAYTTDDLPCTGDALLTTEKDAVKFAALAPRLPVWVLPVEARVAPDLARFVLEKLDGSPSA
ncbi:tetraacyldisaccharide 4'-kinase [Denitratisoma sp. agr-D3]